MDGVYDGLKVHQRVLLPLGIGLKKSRIESGYGVVIR
jgi:hypothetical protein